MKPISTEIQYSVVSTSQGPMFAAHTEKGLCFLSFASEAEGLTELKKEFPKGTFKQTNLDLSRLEKMNLDLQGTPFQRKVWNALLKIPSGKTTTYGAIASEIGHPKAVRAVGTAVGANPICMYVPCHRVLPSTGKVGNYRWGSARKIQLLKDEGAAFKV